MEEKEIRAAQRYSAAELEKMAIESENEVSRLRGEPPKHKGGTDGMTDEEKKKEEESKRAQMMAQAKALIDSGMDPKQVGQMLMGLSIQAGYVQQPAQGMGLDDVLKIVTLVTEKKEVSELKTMIAALEKKIEENAKPKKSDGAEPRPIDPIAFAKQQAEGIKTYYDTIKSLGLIPENTGRTADGRTIEVVKEDNRHLEIMEELKVKRSHNEKLTDIAAKIPKMIGRGIASQITEGGAEEDGGNGNSGGLESFICQEKGCGARIYVTPETGNRIRCGKCGVVYNRPGTETRQPMQSEPATPSMPPEW